MLETRPLYGGCAHLIVKSGAEAISTFLSFDKHHMHA